MIVYFIKRLLLVIPILLGITFFSFILLKNLPGDVVTNMIGERTNPELVEEMRRHIGQEKSLFSQYLGYLKLISEGNLGRSHITQRDVAKDIRQKLPNTIILALTAMLIASPFGILLGYLSAIYEKSTLGKMIDVFVISSISVPVFWGALILMLIFSLTLKMLPPSGTGGLNFLLLPSITLAIPAMATIARITKSSVIDVMSMPWIRTAHSKGLSPLRVNIIHVLKNALIPIITIIGLDIGSYLNGAVVTETIFGWDGLGRYTMEGIIRRDYPVILGSVIVGTTFFVIINAITDIVYHLVDPRIKHEGKEEQR
ncbi:MAG: ABC transporter permease [Thermodesulfovibrionales bacterium]|nr:ABC transporter permease [Thermodesulfovibrionales bacterium]